MRIYKIPNLQILTCNNSKISPHTAEATVVRSASKSAHV